MASCTSALPECLRPVSQDEVAFQDLAQQYRAGHLPSELEQANPLQGGPDGRFFDLTQQPPEPEDFELLPELDQEVEPTRDEASDTLMPEVPETGDVAEDRNVRRRITRDDAYWRDRTSDFSPKGRPTVRPRPEEEEDLSPKARRVEGHDPEGVMSQPLTGQDPSPEVDQTSVIPLARSAAEGEPASASEPPLGVDSELPEGDALCCEFSFDVFDTDIADQMECLWVAL